MDRVMTKELQIMRLKELFRQFNPQGDIQEIDFEAHVDPDLPLPGNIALMETYHPMYVWRKEGLTEEMVSPETVQMREERVRRIELEKERKEHLKKIEAHEQRLRGEVERVVSEEIGALKEELEDLKAQRTRIPQAQPAEIEEMRKDVGRTAERLHEMDLLLMSTYKKLQKLETKKRHVIPTVEIPTEPETRVCQCGQEFIIRNVHLEDKFVRLAIRSGRLSHFAGSMIIKLCSKCQIEQYEDTLLGIVCTDARNGIITRAKIREAGLPVGEFVNICKRGGYPLPKGWT